MERAVFDRMAAIDSDHWWFVGRRAVIDRLIARCGALPADPRILEIGCGTGANLAVLSRFGRVDAIEPDAAARAIAATRSGVAVSDGYLPGGLPADFGPYDLIVLFDVLEHIEQDCETLAAVRALLAPGGRLLVTVPAGRWLWSAHDVAHHHKRRYSARSLRQAFADAGYRIVYRSFFNTLLFPVVALARLAGRFTERVGGDDALPPRALNGVLAALFSAERHLIGRVALPFGISIAAVAVSAQG